MKVGPVRLANGQNLKAELWLGRSDRVELVDFGQEAGPTVAGQKRGRALVKTSWRFTSPLLEQVLCQSPSLEKRRLVQRFCPHAFAFDNSDVLIPHTF